MPLERAIRDAKINISQLDQVVLVGGTTRMPLIRKLVTRLFGRIPAMHLNPDEVIAQGAAIQAALKARHSELQDVVVTDVCLIRWALIPLNRWGIPANQAILHPLLSVTEVFLVVAFVPFTRHMINKQRLILKSTRVKAGWWLIIFSLRSCQ